MFLAEKDKMRLYHQTRKAVFIGSGIVCAGWGFMLISSGVALAIFLLLPYLTWFILRSSGYFTSRPDFYNYAETGTLLGCGASLLHLRYGIEGHLGPSIFFYLYPAIGLAMASAIHFFLARRK